MKKLFCVFFFLILTITVFAQENKRPEKPFSIGAGLEFDMNARHNFAGGALANVLFDLDSRYALGLTFTASTNFNGFSVMEPLFSFRRYVGSNNKYRLFFGLDTGVFIIFEDGDVIPMFDIGLRGGTRIPLGSIFYIEPYGRLGYPFAFGIGAVAGICF